MPVEISRQLNGLTECAVGMVTDDDAAQIDLRELRVGDIAYSIAVFPSSSRFNTAWRCPVCERRQGCSYPTGTHAEAAKCAEEEVHAHHAQYHGDRLQSGAK